MLARSAIGTREMPALGVHLFSRRVVVVAPGRRCPVAARDRAADDDEALADVSAQQAAHERPCGWDQQDRPEDVGDEAGCQQEGAADRDQQAVSDLAAGEAALGKRLVEAAPGAAALVAQ